MCAVRTLKICLISIPKRSGAPKPVQSQNNVFCGGGGGAVLPNKAICSIRRGT